MRKLYNWTVLTCLGLIIIHFNAVAQGVSDFEDLNLPTDSFWNGSDLSGVITPSSFSSTFTSGDFVFTNAYDTVGGWKYWSEGFAYSNKTDSVTSGRVNQYSSRAGGGYNSSIYGIGMNNTIIRFGEEATDTIIDSLFITNSTYAANSMRDGDDFAKKFGGESGDDEDWFLLTIKGLDENDEPTGDSVNFYLADYRFADSTMDYIVMDWRKVELSSLGKIRGLSFILSSSDTNEYGMNTPAFFCIDNITSPNSVGTFDNLTLTTDTFWDGSDYSGTPNDQTYSSEFTSGDAIFNNIFNQGFQYWTDGFAYSNKTDSSTSGSANTYSAKPASGFNSDTYAVGTHNAVIKLEQTGSRLNGVYITNSTYAANSMRDGDDFAKKFGGESGTDPDWFLLTIKGYSNGNISKDSVNFYLADYRIGDASYIIEDWRWVDLAPLGTVDSVAFYLSSSDTNEYGMNTPAFFCIDDFNVANPNASIVQNNAYSTVRVYPNPAINSVQLQLQKSANKIVVTDVTGKEVLTFANTSNNLTLDVSTLKKGIHFIQVQYPSYTETIKFIKK